MGWGRGFKGKRIELGKLSTEICLPLTLMPIAKFDFDARQGCVCECVCVSHSLMQQAEAAAAATTAIEASAQSLQRLLQS